jgi:hypothetical protein
MTARLALVKVAVPFAAALMLVAGCHGSPSTPTPSGTTDGAGGPTTSATASPNPSRSPTPTAPPTDPVLVFAADGIGGYQIGTSLADLTALRLVAHVATSTSCADTKTADTGGPYAGNVSLTFRGDKLSAIHTTSSTYVTPSGAKVGMSLTNLLAIYGTRGTVITGQLGNKAFSVRVPATQLGLVFFLDQSNTTVASMSGGVAQPLEDAVRTGEGC